MKIQHKLFSAVVFCTTFMAGVSSPANAETIDIVPIGDSITQGGAQDLDYTYRYPLFYKLKDAGYDINFIGSLRTGFYEPFAWPARNGVAFDVDHEGHWGWNTSGVSNNLAQWSASWGAVPDIALVHLGTNDRSSNDFDASIVQPLKDIVALLRTKNPRIVVLIGHLNFKDDEPGLIQATVIRSKVEAMAQEVTTQASPVTTVAHYENWVADPDEAGTDTYDWLHPNEQGESKMANKWFAAMQPYLSGSTPTPTPTPGGTGRITREVWTGISGTAVSAIPVNTTPASTGTITSFEAPTNAADNYGQRIRGYLTAPTTGSYTFWIAGDDNVELRLSTTNSANNKVRIAYHNAWTNSRVWNTYATQKSAAITLQAGRQYYIEALMKEGGGGDNLAVGWAKPGQSTTAPSEVIPGSVLSTSLVSTGDVTYSFSDVSHDSPVNGVHSGINFGSGQWGAGNYFGFNQQSGWFWDSAQNNRSFTLPAGTRLKSIKLSTYYAGSTWRIEDGVNTPLSGTFGSENVPITITTGWVNAGSNVKITFSASWDSGIDDITYGNGG